MLHSEKLPKDGCSRFFPEGRTFSGSDGAQSSPNQDIVMEKVKMIDDDSDGNPRVEITMNDFLNE